MTTEIASISQIVLSQEFDNREISECESLIEPVVNMLLSNISITSRKALIFAMANIGYQIARLQTGFQSPGNYYSLTFLALESHVGSLSQHVFIKNFPKITKWKYIWLYIVCSMIQAGHANIYLENQFGSTFFSYFQTISSSLQDIFLYYFYQDGKYSDIPSRILRIRLLHEYDKGEKKSISVHSYRVISWIVCFIALLKSIKYSYQLKHLICNYFLQSHNLRNKNETITRNSNDEENKEIVNEKDLSSGKLSVASISCKLCMESPIVRPTSTICGHVFCWECIVRCLASNARCPVCRRMCDMSTIRIAVNIA